MSAHQLATPTHILISFCNTTSSAPSLGIVDVESGRAEVLRLPPVVAAEDPRGIAISDRYVFVVTGRTKSIARASRRSDRHSRLFILDRHDLRLVSMHSSQLITDAHSLHVGDGHVDVVSTGSDEVVRLSLSGAHVVAEGVVWRPDPDGPRSDIHHLNAICSWQGGIVVSGLGRKTDRLWSSAADGFIASVPRGERLAAGIGHPHSLIELDGRLAYCESATGIIHVIGRDDVGRVPGYARGICRVDDCLFVGISKGRRVSNSTGALSNRADPGAAAGQCAIARLRIDTLAIEQVINLDLMSWEIYDLVAVAGVGTWPVAGEIEWRDSFILGVRADYEERDQTVSWLHTEVGARDSEIRRLHEEVAKRDRTITWLHKEVAERDRTITNLRS